MLEKAIDNFKKYTSNYDMSIMEISLKYYHSLEVMKLMAELAFRLGLDKEKIEVAQVIGLLHDIGRFEQYVKDHELSDRYSDHANESVKYLFEEGHIRDFVDNDKYDNIIKNAIKYHNKKYIGKDVTDKEELMFCKMIRDTDKIDIYRVNGVYYNFSFKADEINSDILKFFNEEKMIDSISMKSNSDKTIYFLGFIHDINFDESFDILVESDNFDLFLSVVEIEKNSEKLWRKIRELCFDKINRGVEND